ncbi:MAG: tyrosine-type recombinase/integrase [Lachnospiraceae bacterium]|nr:tyrosine-type recombinase/integrase [Lachnospiraceae bacterium]
MGKSLKGKELGKGISQRKDGRYRGRFVNRFGKNQDVYDNTYNGVMKKLREAKYADEQEVNVVSSNMTLDEWFDIWIDTCKKNCRNNTKETYRRHYKRVSEDIGWRKLSKLNLVILQNAINHLKTDNERKNTKKILSDMLEKAVDSDLIVKNVAKKLNTIVSNDKKEERRVLTRKETRLFLEEAKSSFYYDLFIVALENGMRIGELTGLLWEDVDFKGKILHVRHSLTYFSKNGTYVFELHSPKTKKGYRDIPLTQRAIDALHRQYVRKQDILMKGRKPLEDFENLVFITKNNRPTTQFLVSEGIDSIVKRINKKFPDISFERFTCHTFRHTAATRYLEANVPLKTVSAILGHTQLQLTTDLYMHVTDDAIEEGMRLYEMMG